MVTPIVAGENSLRPGVHLGLSGLLHHPLVGPHALAVERRKHQPAAIHVDVALLDQEGVLAEQRREDDVAPLRDRVDAVGSEERLQRGRIRDEDHLPDRDDAEGEGAAVLAAAALHQRHRADHQAQGLQRSREGGSWRQ
jgi:hypothetical protein